VLSDLSLAEQKYLEWLFDEHTLKSSIPLWKNKIDTSKIAENIDPRSIFLQQELTEKNWTSRQEFISFLLKPESVNLVLDSGLSQIIEKG
jgi:hypothetical protein